jgi:1-acyl-sn-glycerol-3-phosphate acyltransferase
VIASAVTTLTRLIVGANVRGLEHVDSASPRVFFANHTSHLDALVVWTSLPQPVRARTRPVAARDYWGATAFRRLLAERVFHAVLIERKEVRRSANPLAAMVEVLARGESLILFPEGTRGDGERIGPFKSGLFHIARERADVDLVPVHIDNLNRVLPKGEFLPVPMLACITFGPALRLRDGEAREAFLQRAEDCVRALSTP